MAIGIGVPLNIKVRGQWLGQRWENDTWWLTDGAAFLTATATGVGEAFWNDIKTVYRAAFWNGTGLTVDNILVSEPGDEGAFGEYPVPPGERQGTRAGELGQFLPTFTAAGIRQSVATRATRPGQKRIVGGTEADALENDWAAGYLTLINAIGAKLSEPITLGAPVATGVLIPIVYSKGTQARPTPAWQEIVGYVTNPSVTSQVSRKRGRGI